MKKLKIIADAHVPFLDPLREAADVTTLVPADIVPETVRDADALIVRTRTRCDRSLLEGTNVKFVATATIGTDHFDKEWLDKAGIGYANAPGCNAPAVAQYVFSSLARIINRPLNSYTIGIVGVGHVGSIVERWARAMEMNVLLCDPPRQRAEGGDGWCSLEDIARKADIITFHTPLTKEGPDATYHLADSAFFNSLRRAPIIVNVARGPVVDTGAWLKAIELGIVGPAVVDCWEGEPAIDLRLLEAATIATPHIAGYSLAGKMRASVMAVDALADFFNRPRIDLGLDVPPVPASVTVSEMLASYDPLVDTAILRERPADFESLRDNYDLRPEPRGSVCM